MSQYSLKCFHKFTISLGHPQNEYITPNMFKILQSKHLCPLQTKLYIHLFDYSDTFKWPSEQLYTERCFIPQERDGYDVRFAVRSKPRKGTPRKAPHSWILTTVVGLEKLKNPRINLILNHYLIASDFVDKLLK